VTGQVAGLNTAWFSLIGLLWTGYFVLEGFDFGVGILAPFVSGDDVDRRLCLNSIGPFWDGNEVWLIVAGGAMFAAFPTWYATMFSGFYLALFLILVALIVRGVAFEFRAKQDAASWRRTWDVAMFVGSLVPALLWGVAFTDLVRGLAIGPGPRYIGGFGGLIHPIALLGGVASLTVFCLHGAVFLALKTTGELRRRARRAAMLLVAPTVAAVAGLGAWVAEAVAGTSRPDALPGAVPVSLVVLAVVCLGVTALMVVRGRDRTAFAATAVVIFALSGAAFAGLFPRVMVSRFGAADSLTIWNAASAHETLLVMTVVAAIFTPFVLAYQAWSYWVFRQRLVRPPGSRDDMTPPGGPLPGGPLPEEVAPSASAAGRQPG
jgi:cytochrome d ubiquinol oxidase subunit II